MSVTAVALCGCGEPGGRYGPQRRCWRCWAAEKGWSGSTPLPVPEPPERQLVFVTPRELRRRSPEGQEWIWDGYVARGGITLLGGLPKAGKSTLAFGLVEAVRSGAPQFLGRPVSGSAVVVLTEESALTILDKLAASDNVRLLVREDAWPLPSWPELVAAAVQEANATGARLLVIDSLAFWAQFAGEAENDAGAAARAFAPLQEAAAAGLAVLLPVHQRKSGGEAGTAIRGSGAIAASADMLLELERVPDASPLHRQLLAVGRWPAPPMLLADYDPASGAWRVIGQGAGREAAPAISWRQRILEALPKSEPGATLDELAEVLEADRRKWAEAMKALLAEGEIKRAGRGTKGDPYRHHRPPDSAPGFRPTPGAESAAEAAIQIPPAPFRAAESDRQAEGEPPRAAAAPGRDQTLLDALGSEEGVVRAIVAEFNAVELEPGERRRGCR